MLKIVAVILLKNFFKCPQRVGCRLDVAQRAGTVCALRAENWTLWVQILPRAVLSFF